MVERSGRLIHAYLQNIITIGVEFEHCEQLAKSIQIDQFSRNIDENTFDYTFLGVVLISRACRLAEMSTAGQTTSVPF
jgi:hypothetical protein